MTAPAMSPRSATYSNAAIFGATFGLLALLAIMGALSAVVRDANTHARIDKVIAGKISVVGSAKVRLWESEGFSVRVPAGWGLIASGPADFAVVGETEQRQSDALYGPEGRRVIIHRWQGDLSKSSSTECAAGAVCAEVRIETPNRRPGSRASDDVRAYARARIHEVDQAARDQALAAGGAATAAASRFIDLGPVTVRGGRWAWRWSSRAGDEDQVSYFFSTCRHATVAQFWEVAFRAPAAANVQQQFFDMLASIKTDLPTPDRSEGDCSGVLDR